MSLSANEWHSSMYDTQFAQNTLGAPQFLKLARQEAEFLVKALRLKKGSRILDVPCGVGRHSKALAELGMSVTGVDINSDCLRLARGICKGKQVRLTRGDMADLSKYEGQFDAVINWFTSFGYFESDSANEHVMRQMIHALKPGGRFAIQLINRDWLLKVFRPVDWSKNGESFVMEARKYDPQTCTNESQRIVLDEKTGRAKRFYHRVRLYSMEEMVALLHGSGLANIRVYSGYEGGRFQRHRSTHPIYVGEKSYSE